MKVEYLKTCNCSSTSSTRAIRVLDASTERSFTMTVTWHPGPSCDLCGKPWRRRRER